MPHSHFFSVCRSVKDLLQQQQNHEHEVGGLKSEQEAVVNKLAEMQRQLDEIRATSLARKDAQQFIRAMGLIGSIQSGMSMQLRQLDLTMQALWDQVSSTAVGVPASGGQAQVQLLMQAQGQLSALADWVDKGKSVVAASTALADASRYI